MAVTTADVLHVAALARLKLAPDEVERLTSQLNDILGHVAELAAAGTEQVQPEPATTWPAPLRGDDAPPDGLTLPPAAMAPAWLDGFFTVPRLAAMELPPESAP